MEVRGQDFWFMLLTTIRHSMGRCSYAPSYAVELFHRYKQHLSAEQIEQVRGEVAAELKGRRLGHDIDHRTWEEFERVLAPQPEE